MIPLNFVEEFAASAILAWDTAIVAVSARPL